MILFEISANQWRSSNDLRPQLRKGSMSFIQILSSWVCTGCSYEALFHLESNKVGRLVWESSPTLWVQFCQVQLILSCRLSTQFASLSFFGMCLWVEWHFLNSRAITHVISTVLGWIMSSPKFICWNLTPPISQNLTMFRDMVLKDVFELK
jgi:hypothetical protein